MISHFFGIAWHEVELVAVSVYMDMLEQAFNIAGLYVGTGFDFMSKRESDEQLRLEYEAMKADGIIKSHKKE